MNPQTIPMSTDAFERARAAFVAGIAAFESGRLEEAEAEFLASLALLPGRPSTLVNLAATRLKLGRPAEAASSLREALAAQPDDGPAWVQLGIALMELRQHDQALPAFDRALALDGRQPVVHHQRGLALMGLERPAEAAQAWEQAVAQDGKFVTAWIDLGSLMRDLGQLSRARQCLRQALALGANDPLVHFQLAGLKEPSLGEAPDTSQGPPDAPPPTYVEQLFDSYAEDFDEHLVQRLGYCAPAVLVEGLAQRTAQRFTHALDLGCGTGLCAEPLAPICERLDGVDLSAGMLEKARALGRYTALTQADVVAHLQATPHHHDLIVAADVFIYVGALEAVFASVQRCLTPGGWFCFSVEAADDAAGFVLRSSLRYAHSAGYLRQLAQRHGLEVQALEPHPLRRDEREGVQGLYGWLKRPIP